jgi:hypothetical protein
LVLCRVFALVQKMPAPASIADNTHLPGSASRFALFPANSESRRAQQVSENRDEERVRRRRSAQSRISFLDGLVLSEAGDEVRICLLAEARPAKAILPVGRLSAKRSKNWSPDTYRFLLEAPAPGPVGSRKPI